MMPMLNRSGREVWSSAQGMFLHILEVLCALRVLRACRDR